MSTLSTVVQATGLFVVTNIDDVVVLALFYAQGAGLPGTTRKVLLGQYLGFGGIVLAAVVLTVSAGALLPQGAIAYAGLLPLLLGLRAAWRAWRSREDDDDVDGLSVATIAAVTLANGGDNIGVYVPVFLRSGAAATAVYCAVFLGLVAVLVLTARYVATRPVVARLLDRWEGVLFPVVLIVLGVVILVEGGAFGL